NFTVDMNLVLAPTGVNGSSLPCDWEVIEAKPQMSGAFSHGGGLAAQFVNPTQGGVYRFRGRCDGSPWTEGNVVLPLSGASIDGVFASGMVDVDATIAHLLSHYTYLERQTISFGEEWFNDNGVGDYLGRVDSALAPTVWHYNQVNDLSGMGAVATFRGVPMRVAKLSNFLVAYETERINVFALSRWLARYRYGTWDDDAGSASWDAGTAVADGADLDETMQAMATNVWAGADVKERRLWPNARPTDNHTTFMPDIDFNFNFISPGFTTQRVGDGH
ncbi:MAG: hypothetical protein IJ173_12565, partial [Kiritimatiellae bacterium]|nr:hypothetical protein [Kiritimatiellia bacterium]